MVYKRHFGVVKTLERVTWNYLRLVNFTWTDYVSACDVCCRSKIPRHRLYDLLESLPVLVGRWKSISVNFIIDLTFSKGYDVILRVVDRLQRWRIFFHVWRLLPVRKQQILFARSFQTPWASTYHPQTDVQTQVQYIHWSDAILTLHRK